MDYRERYELWLNSPHIDEVDREELRGLPEEEIRDRFYMELGFGTAGLRGIRGIGSNRMNAYVVRRVAEAYGRVLKRNGSPELKNGVIMAYDCRILSRELALEAGRVLSAAGIRVYMFDDYRSTPEISYAIRCRQAAGGFMFTASHNPPEYNGLKVYNAQGCQLSDEQSRHVMEELESIEGFGDIGYDPKGKTIRSMPGSQNQKYLKTIRGLHQGKPNRDLRIAFTPLHGVGGQVVRDLFTRLGYNLTVVESQFAPNGNFPTTRKPNPEETESLKLLMETGQESGAHLLLATDPDADRLGVAVLHEGQYRVITGNQLGGLLTDYLIRTRKHVSPSYIIKTVVTSDFCSVIAKNNNVGVSSTLTGFKYIGARMEELLEDDRHVVFAFEESIGYLPGTHIRDKDGVASAVIVAEMAGAWLREGKTLVDRLEDLYQEYGYYLEDTINIYLEGEEGKKQILGLMVDFRQNGIELSDGLEVAHTQDFLKDIEGFEKSNVLRYYLKNHSWFAIRPSGTEPKIKIYISAVGRTRQEAEMNLGAIQGSIDKRVSGYLNSH